MLLFQRLTLPTVELLIEPDPGHLGHWRDDRKYLHVIARNRGDAPIVGYFFPRSPATMCRAYLTLMTEDYQAVFTPGHEMKGRWVNTPEPVTVNIIDEQHAALIAAPHLAQPLGEIDPQPRLTKGVLG